MKLSYSTTSRAGQEIHLCEVEEGELFQFKYMVKTYPSYVYSREGDNLIFIDGTEIVCLDEWENYFINHGYGEDAQVILI